MDTQNKDEDVINAELFGNDVRVDYDCEESKINLLNSFKSSLDSMIESAKTEEDLSAIGSRINYAIDNKLNINVIDYQFKAARKMTEIDNKKETKD